jgi:hypothetical protein
MAKSILHIFTTLTAAFAINVGLNAQNRGNQWFNTSSTALQKSMV